MYIFMQVNTYLDDEHVWLCTVVLVLTGYYKHYSQQATQYNISSFINPQTLIFVIILAINQCIIIIQKSK